MAGVMGKISEPFKAVKKFLTLNDFDVVRDVSVPPLGKEAALLPTKSEGDPFKAVLLDKIVSAGSTRTLSAKGRSISAPAASAAAASAPPQREISKGKSLFGGKGYTREVEKKTGEPLGLEFQALMGFYELTEPGEDGKSVAICIKDSNGKIVIFGYEPLFPGQEPSDTKCDDLPMYPYYEFKEPKNNTYASHFIAVVNEKGDPAYTVHQAGSAGNMNQHIVRYRNKPAALIERSKKKDLSGSFHITVNPGIDPCLIIFLAALCIKLDGKEEEGNIFQRFGKEIIA